MTPPDLNLRDQLSSIKSGFHEPTIVGSESSQESMTRMDDACLAQWAEHWDDESGTRDFANRLAICPAIAHATVALHGDLGAGKTTFVRHLLRALGVRGRIKSPTYAIVEPHEATDCPLMPADEVLAVWHFDFYRFDDPREWEDAGFRELFASAGLKLVEWPEKAESLINGIDIDIFIEPDDTRLNADVDPEEESSRHVTAKARTLAGRRLVEALRNA